MARTSHRQLPKHPQPSFFPLQCHSTDRCPLLTLALTSFFRSLSSLAKLFSAHLPCGISLFLPHPQALLLHKDQFSFFPFSSLPVSPSAQEALKLTEWARNGGGVHIGILHPLSKSFYS